MLEYKQQACSLLKFDD